MPAHTFIRSTLLVPMLLCLACSSDKAHVRTDTSTSATESSLANIVSPRLAGGAASREQLISKALVAFMCSDTSTLLSLLVTRSEFEHYIYHEYGIHYPAARNTSEQGRAFIWENQMMSSAAGLRRGLAELHNAGLDLIAVDIISAPKRFDSYILHEETRAHARRPDGREVLLLFPGSIIEMDGTFKFLTYRDRD